MNPLIKLLLDNRKATCRSGFRIENADDSATVFLYDMIVDSALDAEFFGGIAPEPFVKELSAISASTIHLRINSPGGSVFGARAIEQALREHPARVVVHVDGLAASAASVIAMAGDEIEIAEGGFIMIHRAWTIAMGNAEDLLDTASLLEKVDDTLVATYARRTEQKPDTVRQLMNDETWFTGPEAVEAGFADRISEGASANGAWNLSAYQHAPKITEPAEPVMPTHDFAAEHRRRQLELRKRIA